MPTLDGVLRALHNNNGRRSGSVLLVVLVVGPALGNGTTRTWHGHLEADPHRAEQPSADRAGLHMENAPRRGRSALRGTVLRGRLRNGTSAGCKDRPQANRPHWRRGLETKRRPAGGPNVTLTTRQVPCWRGGPRLCTSPRARSRSSRTLSNRTQLHDVAAHALERLRMRMRLASHAR